MTLSESVRTCLTQKYASFSGRASRSEYWWFMGAYLFFGMGVGLLGKAAQLVFVLAVICPLVAVGARRLQDTGRPGALIFVPLALALLFAWLAPGAPAQGTPGVQPVTQGEAIGALAMMLIQMLVALIYLWLLTRPGDDRANAYGPPPETVAQEA
ncbi:DUF805 domain-containing protein [Palleronia pelagia]|uniref:Uncharacterized membrane protein YhaH, DUF805 family n=1 Tax=Palleronia pelagia TaxID=387096 RepID=A0A1H8GGP6_9RHOB|nr:DUF805 domain-containing protein [Palleronia pelagia]SEN42950.1 Uncharacterized membrane protein YhaH, DUF805 family [Palleronia pelagia]